jgi:hypothetical protein
MGSQAVSFAIGLAEAGKGLSRFGTVSVCGAGAALVFMGSESGKYRIDIAQ